MSEYDSSSSEEEFHDNAAPSNDSSECAFMERLKKWYPFVDFEQTAVPMYWNAHDKGEFVDLSSRSLRGKHTISKHQQQSIEEERPSASLIRANAPVPKRAGIYYYEVTLESGSDGRIGVGFAPATMAVYRMPGWDGNSYGYHGDDGNFFTSDGNGISYGPRFKGGDVIGAGINLVTNSIFFTINGRYLGIASQVIRPDELFPAVGMQDIDAIVYGNFGQRPFLYDPSAERQVLNSTLNEIVDKVTLPVEKKSWMMDTVCSWLYSEGHVHTLKTLAKSHGLKFTMKEEAIERRNHVRSLILARRTTEAVEFIEKNVPDLFERNPRIELLLKCQVFVEKAQKIAFASPPVPSNGTSHPDASKKTQKRRHNDAETGTTSREEPPTRRSPADEGCTPSSSTSSSVTISASHKNGTATQSGNGVAKNGASMKSYKRKENLPNEDTSRSYNNTRCGFTVQERTDADAKYDEIITYGQQISKLRNRISDLTAAEQAQVNDALISILATQDNFLSQPCAQPEHIKQLAKEANSALMVWEGFPSISVLEAMYKDLIRTKNTLRSYSDSREPFMILEDICWPPSSAPESQESPMDVEN